ncbi:MAG: sigma-70 family RNA polymerase sigma factor [Isosphaeraceae bacterium]
MPDDSKTTLSSLAQEAAQEAALTSAFERLQPRLLAMIGRRVSSKLAARVDPEGVVQETFIRARQRWLVLDPKPADLDAWIYRQALDRLTERVRSALGKEHDVDREVPWQDGASGALVDHMVDSQTGPATALSRAARREVVRAALERLDPVDREILSLRYFDGLSFKEIAAVLNLKENTANTRALRAAVRFRQLLPAAFRPPRSEPQ